VRVQFTKAIVAVATLTALGLGPAWGQAQQPSPDSSQPTQQQGQPGQPQWKDTAEYELYESMRKELVPQKRLELLDSWTKKYPDTAMRELRLQAYLETYRQLDQAGRMLETARELLTVNPKNPAGQYWACALVVSTNSVKPEDLSLAERSAQGLLATERPAQVTDEQWKQSKQQVDIMAYRTLGWVAVQRKNWTVAETNLTQELKLNPLDAQASMWLGSAIRGQQKPERQSEALFYFARAAAYDGPGALLLPDRKQMEGYLQKAYATFHGQDPEGLQQLLTVAKSNAFPPEGFKILSEAEVLAQRHELLKRTNPALAIWVTIKSGLTAEDGAAYFEQYVKNTVLPPENQPALRGTVISGRPELRPTVLVLGIEKPDVAEVTLRVDAALPGRVAIGQQIDFRGVATEFAAQPFMLTFEVEKKNISGWPTPPPPPKKAARRPVVRKK
jgi:tetratricopeptide (TPR) repeat protein